MAYGGGGSVRLLALSKAVHRRPRLTTDEPKIPRLIRDLSAFSGLENVRKRPLTFIPDQRTSGL